MTTQVKFRQGGSSGSVVFDTASRGWIVETIDTAPPQPKYDFIEVPGRSGFINLSRAVSGAMAYDKRSVVMRMSYTSDFRQVTAFEYYQVQGLIHGKELFVETPLGGYDNAEVAITAVEYVDATVFITVEVISATLNPLPEKQSFPTMPTRIKGGTLGEVGDDLTYEARAYTLEGAVASEFQWWCMETIDTGAGDGLYNVWNIVADYIDDYTQTDTLDSSTLTFESTQRMIEGAWVFKCYVLAYYSYTPNRYSREVYTDQIGITERPQITTQPTAATVAENATATFTIETNDPDAVYRWEYELSGGSWQTAPEEWGGDTDTLSFTATAEMDDAKVRCFVTFSDGSEETSDEADLSVTIVFRITQQPQNVTIAALGESISFSVACNDPNATYRWYYKTLATGVNSTTTLTGYNTSTLGPFEATSTRINGRGYLCKVTFSDTTDEMSEYATCTVQS